GAGPELVDVRALEGRQVDGEEPELALVGIPDEAADGLGIGINGVDVGLLAVGREEGELELFVLAYLRLEVGELAARGLELAGEGRDLDLLGLDPAEVALHGVVLGAKIADLAPEAEHAGEREGGEG